MKLLRCSIILLLGSALVISGQTVVSKQLKVNSSMISLHLIGGSGVTGLDQYPWMVSIQKTAPAPTFFCGGSLIHVNWVLTSAYCANGTSFTIRGGTLTINSGPSTIASAVIPHPGYSKTYSHNNIALLKLSQPANPSNTLKTIKLLPRSLCWETANYRNVLTGWGAVSTTATTFSLSLKQIGLTDIPNIECMDKAGSAYVITSVMCTSANAAAMPYVGDEGNPLVRVPGTSSNYPYMQVGVASLYKPSLPSLFTRVCHYHDWIQKVTGLNLGGT